MRKILVAVALSAVVVGPGMALAQSALPPGPGRNVVVSKCSGCHATALIQSERHDADGWDETVDKMVDRGMVISDADRAQVVTYLTKVYGPAAKAAAAPAAKTTPAKSPIKPVVKAATKPKPKS
jgi:hypothetical protein